MNIGEEVKIHEIIPQRMPFEGEEIAEDQPDFSEEDNKEVEVPSQEETVGV